MGVSSTRCWFTIPLSGATNSLVNVPGPGSGRSREMTELICIVMTWPRVTHRKLLEYPGVPELGIWSYDALFRARKLPSATWIFTDMDRLGSWELELAAHARRELLGRGMRVLNDPARFCSRFTLLQRLWHAGINSFRVWRLENLDAVDRWPVFLRTEAAHRGVLSDLIDDPDRLRLEIERALAAGHVECNLMIVEYCAEPLRPGLFRKLAAFRVDDRIVTTLAVHEGNWMAKYGQEGIAGAELYREELDNLAENRHAEVLMRAFQLAHIDYGRVDYAIVKGEPRIYEINSNPTIGRVTKHSDPSRMKSAKLWEGNFVAALAAIDSHRGPAFSVRDPMLRAQRRRDFFLLRSRWVK